MDDRASDPRNVIILDDHKGKIVDSVLLPEIKVYRDKTVSMFIPNIADDPVTMRDLSAIFHHLADVLLEKASTFKLEEDT